MQSQFSGLPLGALGAAAGADPGQFYIAELGPIVLAGNAAGKNVLTLPNNRPFQWVFAAAVSTGAFSSLITDGSTQYQFSNQEVHSSNLWGTAQNPLPLITPYVFRRQILVSLTDLSGAGNTIRLAFIGLELGTPGR